MAEISCSICDEPGGVELGGLLKVQPCGHYFHGSHIIEWCERKPSGACTCPNCRTIITSMVNSEGEEQSLLRPDEAPPAAAAAAAGALGALASQYGAIMVNAAANGDAQRVMVELARGVPVDFSYQGRSAIEEATLRGHANIVEILLATGAAANYALQLAVYQGRAEIVSLMLGAGVDVDDHLLFMAVRMGQLGVVNLMLAAGANPNAIHVAEEDRLAVLNYAVENQHTLIASALLQAGAAVNFFDENQSLEPALFAATAASVECVEMLVGAGANVNTVYKSNTALSIAILVGKEAVVPVLLRAGADVNAAGGAALIQASKTGNVAMVNILLQAGADVNARPSENSYTALHCASNIDKGDLVIPILLQAGANVNLTNHGSTALMYAARRLAAVRTIRLLLEAGADINATDNDGDSALIKAVSNHNWKVVQVLLDPGNGARELVRINDRNRVGITALRVALGERGNRALIVLKELLKMPDLDMNATYERGNTALSVVIELGSLPFFLELLADDRTDVNAMNPSGETPLMIAVSKGNSTVYDSMVKALIEDRFRIDLNAQNPSNGMTALMLAVSPAAAAISGANATNPLNALNYLLSSPSLGINQQDSQGKTALMHAVLGLPEGNPDFVGALLIDPRMNVNVSDEKEITALGYAVVSGNIMAANMLLRMPNIDVNKNPLFALCIEGNCDLDMLNLLAADPRIDPNAVIRGPYVWGYGDYSVGDTCLMMYLMRSEFTFPASESETDVCLRKLRLLLNMPRMDVNKVNASGMSALQYMIMVLNGINGPNVFATLTHANLYLSMLRMLLAVDSLDVNLTCKGDTALMMALQSCDYSLQWNGEFITASKAAEPYFRRTVVAALLTARGMDVNIRNLAGKSARELTTDLEILQMLDSHASPTLKRRKRRFSEFLQEEEMTLSLPHSRR
jgi:ankyrin repeat protein